MTDIKKSLVEKLDTDLEKFLRQKIEESKNKPRSFNFDNKTVDEIAEVSIFSYNLSFIKLNFFYVYIYFWLKKMQ